MGKNYKKANKKANKTEEISMFKKGIVVGLHIAEWSVRKIAQEVGIGKSTVQRIITNYEETGSAEPKIRPGRPRSTTERQDRSIKIASVRNPKLSSRAIGLQLKSILKKTISPRTIRRRLVDAGLPGRIARKKPFLTALQTDYRLRWCKERKDWSSEEWENVLWSDESPFTLFADSGRLWIHRRVGEEYRKECLAPTVKFGGGKLMVWGCFSAHGVGDIYRINGKVNAARYREILKHHMAQKYRKMGKNVIFQHDNASSHTAKKVKTYLSNAGIRVLPWPSQSPDLNPIENLWALIKHDLYYKAPKASNLDELFNIIKEIWESFPIELIRKLVHSMPRRVNAVIRNNGGHTRY